MRLFVELSPEGIAERRLELAERSVPVELRIDHPDGNELLFPFPP